MGPEAGPKEIKVHFMAYANSITQHNNTNFIYDFFQWQVRANYESPNLYNVIINTYCGKPLRYKYPL